MKKIKLFSGTLLDPVKESHLEREVNRFMSNPQIEVEKVRHNSTGENGHYICVVMVVYMEKEEEA